MRFIQGFMLLPLLLPVLPFMVMAAVAAIIVALVQGALVVIGAGEFIENDGYENAYHPKF